VRAVSTTPTPITAGWAAAFGRRSRSRLKSVAFTHAYDLRVRILDDDQKETIMTLEILKFLLSIHITDHEFACFALGCMFTSLTITIVTQILILRMIKGCK
jgi:hypothetical protein